MHPFGFGLRIDSVADAQEYYCKALQSCRKSARPLLWRSAREYFHDNTRHFRGEPQSIRQTG
jgi:hypothetical protein